MSASMAPDFISLSIYMFKNTKISYKTFGIHDHSKPWQEATKETFYPDREGCVGNVTWGCFNILRFYFYEILCVAPGREKYISYSTMRIKNPISSGLD